MGFSLPALPTVHSPGQFGIATHVVFVEDFITGGYGTSIGGKFATTANAAEWLVTDDATSTQIISDSAVGGVVTLDPTTSAGDFCSCQLNGESFAVRNNKKMWFGARFKISDADDGPYFMGMASTDVTGTTLGPIYDGTNDSIGFRAASSSSAVMHYVVEDDTTETAATTGVTLENDTFVEVGFFLNGRSYVEMYVNGARVYKGSTNIPDNDVYLTPTMEIGSTTGTTSTTMSVDWIYAICER